MWLKESNRYTSVSERYTDNYYMSRGPTPVEHEMIESQRFLIKKSHRDAFVIDIVMLVHCCYYPGPRGFSRFFTAWESCERAAKRWTRDAKRRERKTSGRFGLQSHLGQDLILELGLVDIFTNTQINTIGPFDRQYRGHSGDICYCTSWERICLQNTAVLSLYKRSRFSCVLHSFCFWQCLRRNLTSPLDGRFPEIESLNEHQSLVRSHKSQRCVRHSANWT